MDTTYSLLGAIVIQPLTLSQANDYLEKMGQELKLVTTDQADPFQRKLEPHRRLRLLAGQQIRLGSEPYHLTFHLYPIAAFWEK